MNQKERIEIRCEKRQGWIGVDLDGTLAEYYGWDGRPKDGGGIGEPVEEMRMRVMSWLEAGKDVRIFTARVAPSRNDSASILMAQQQFHWIHEWCLEHLGRSLPVVCQKDMAMIELWDDRCVQVIPNTGEPAVNYKPDDREVF